MSVPPQGYDGSVDWFKGVPPSPDVLELHSKESGLIRKILKRIVWDKWVQMGPRRSKSVHRGMPGG